VARDQAGEASWNCDGKKRERKEGCAKEIAGPRCNADMDEKQARETAAEKGAG